MVVFVCVEVGVAIWKFQQPRHSSIVDSSIVISHSIAVCAHVLAWANLQNNVLLMVLRLLKQERRLKKDVHPRQRPKAF